jgi:hypothetical protein
LLAGIDSTPTAGIVIDRATIGAEVRTSVLPFP